MKFKNKSTILKILGVLILALICAFGYVKMDTGKKVDIETKVIDDNGTWVIKSDENISYLKERIKILDPKGSEVELRIRENKEKDKLMVEPVKDYEVGKRYRLIIDDIKYKNNINNNYMREFDVNMKPIEVKNFEKVNELYRLKITFNQEIQVNSNLYEHISINENYEGGLRKELRIKLSNEKDDMKVLYIDINESLNPGTEYKLTLDGNIVSVYGNIMMKSYTEYFKVDKVLLDEKLGLGKYESKRKSLNRKYEWYIEQKGSGEFQKENSGPAVAAMSALWALDDEKITIERVRDIYYPQGDEWFIDTLVSFYKEFSIKAVVEKDIDSYKIRKSIDNGNIVVAYIDPKYIAYKENDEVLTGRFIEDVKPHYIIIKGYVEADDNVFYEVYDPYTFGVDEEKFNNIGKDRYYDENQLVEAITNAWNNMAIVSSEK